MKIHQPVQGTRVRPLVQEDPTCLGATKPTTEAHVPEASMWYLVAMVLSAWAPMEDWEAVNGSPDNIEKTFRR